MWVEILLHSHIITMARDALIMLVSQSASQWVWTLLWKLKDYSLYWTSRWFLVFAMVNLCIVVYEPTLLTWLYSNQQVFGMLHMSEDQNKKKSLITHNSVIYNFSFALLWIHFLTASLSSQQGDIVKGNCCSLNLRDWVVWTSSWMASLCFELDKTPAVVSHYLKWFGA